jgi:hypothetical protein
MPDPNLPLDPEPTEPTVHELLLARIDEHCRLLTLELDQAAKPASNWHPNGPAAAGTLLRCAG